MRGARQHLAEQPRADRLVQRGQGLGHGGERDDVGQRGTRPEHGGRHDQVLRGPGQLGDADQHERGERAGCGQDPGGVGERVGRQLGQQRRGMQRVAVGVVAKAAPGLRGQGGAAERAGERDDLLGVETPQPHAMNQMVLRQAALPPGGLGRGVVARRDDDEDLVAAQPPADEHERAPGGVVDPLGVVDHDHHRSGGLQPAEHGQQLRAHRQRVRVGRRSRGEERPAQPVRHVGDELGQHSEREPGLALLAAAPQDADAGLIDEQAADERGLPDARGTAQPQDARLPGPDPVELAPHRRELADPADERAVPGHTCQSVAAWPGGEPPSPRRGVSLTHRARRRAGPEVPRFPSARQQVESSRVRLRGELRLFDQEQTTVVCLRDATQPGDRVTRLADAPGRGSAR